MSTIKSSDEHLTLNADGTSKDIKFQANGVEKASISSAGAFTSTTIDATKLTGALPAIDGSSLTGISVNAVTGNLTVSGDITGGNNGSIFLLDNAGQKAGEVQTDSSAANALQIDADPDNTNADSYTAFRIDNSEKMRIDSSGNLLVGKTVAGSAEGCQLESVGTAFLVRSNGPAAICGRNDSTGEVIRIVDSGTTVGTISVNGSATAYNTTSDYRLKENVDYTWDATTRLKQLKPARFNFIADDTNTLVDGFIAHEVSSVVPEAISGEKDAMMDEEYEVTPAVEEVRDEEGNITTEAVEAVMGTRSVPDYQGIDQSKLVPLLVKTIQELEARITALEA